MSQDQQAREGYLLLADISGYTAFLAGTELEHANAIVRELTTLVRARLSPPMRFVKLEGDAVFCHADEKTFEDGERLVELIETCYFGFSNRLLDMERETTCRCAACASIGSLSYFTNRFTPLGRRPLFFPGIETFEFIPTGTGTRIDYRFRLEDRGPLTRLRFRIVRPAARRLLTRSEKTLRRALDEDAVSER